MFTLRLEFFLTSAGKPAPTIRNSKRDWLRAICQSIEGNFEEREGQGITLKHVHIIYIYVCLICSECSGVYRLYILG